MKTVLRLLFFWIKVIAVILIIVVLAGMSFFISMDFVNLSILVKDGMQYRANVIFQPEDYDAEPLTKYFTAEYLAKDVLLRSEPYAQYEITNFDYDTKVERLWCWPWQNEVTMTIACRQREVEGRLKEEFMTQEQIDAGERISAEKLDNMRYRVHCERLEDHWMITGLELVETFEEEEKTKQTPEPTATEPETTEEGTEETETASE